MIDCVIVYEFPIYLIDLLRFDLENNLKKVSIPLKAMYFKSDSVEEE